MNIGVNVPFWIKAFSWYMPRSGIAQAYVAAAAAKSLQSCPTLCDPIDGSPPGSAIPGILQARTSAWVAISFSNAWKWKVKVKSCLALSDPMDCSLPGSSVHGIFQARVLEWVAIAFSQAYVSYSFIFLRNFITLCIMTVPIYIPTNSVGSFSFLHTLSRISCL